METEFSYDFRVLCVVENQPFSLVGLTIIKPVQASRLDKRPAILVSMVERSENGRPIHTVGLGTK